MFYRFLLTLGSLMTFLCLCCGDPSCQYQPVFTPSRLVVKYGDPTTAKCVVCKDDCSTQNGLEISVGKSKKDGSTLTWTVEHMTVWDIEPMCFYELNDVQCVSTLPVTVYQPPQSVSIRVVNHTGPMRECGEYTLQCIVGNAAPVENLIVTFYRGETRLGHIKSKHRNIKKPMSETFTLSSNNTYDEDLQFWCEARLDLGPEGPQPTPVVKSETLDATFDCQIRSFGPGGDAASVFHHTFIFCFMLLTSLCFSSTT